MKMPFVMKLTAALSFLLCVLFALLKWSAAAITFGTICYHFTMRLLVGLTIDRIMQNHANYNHAWFQQRAWEARARASTVSSGGFTRTMFFSPKFFITRAANPMFPS